MKKIIVASGIALFVSHKSFGQTFSASIEPVNFSRDALLDYWGRIVQGGLNNQLTFSNIGTKYPDMVK